MRVSPPLILLLPLLCHPLASAGEVRTYETPHYIIYTDLSPDQAREAGVRMTRMAEEYSRRMRDFGRPRAGRKLPFYLFADAEDYYATGAPRESAGRYNGNALLAVAEDFGPKTWHLVQHEGFHQFADAYINANLPIWINEGLAEYFGEAVFTGDGYVTGAIPQWRLERVRRRFERGEFKPVEEVMSMQTAQWNRALSLTNYDQVWSMVQFLAHGEDGRYQKALGAFMGQLGAGQNARVAWRRAFGDTIGLEQKWREYWQNLPDHPTADLYAKATVATLTSFIARASSQGRSFSDMDEFAAADRQGPLPMHAEDWLPQRLLLEALESASKLALAGATLTLEQPAGAATPRVRCVLPDGRTWIGTFTLSGGRVSDVSVQPGN